MKKICILILSLFFILNCNTSAFAASTNAVNIVEIFDDGSYIEDQIENIPLKNQELQRLQLLLLQNI